MRISELSARSGITVPTIKFYLRDGLLAPGSPRAVNQADYGEPHLHRLRLIRALSEIGGLRLREIRGVLSLKPIVEGGWRVPIVKTEALRGEGVAELVEKLDEHRARIAEEGTLSERRRRNLRSEVLALCTFRLRARLEESLAEDERFAELLDEVVARRLDPATAASRILERAWGTPGGVG